MCFFNFFSLNTCATCELFPVWLLTRSTVGQYSVSPVLSQIHTQDQQKLYFLIRSSSFDWVLNNPGLERGVMGNHQPVGVS